MKFEIGDVIIINDGMTLRVKDAKSNWVKCDYLASGGEWKARGRTEQKAKLESLIREGTAKLLQNEQATKLIRIMKT